MADWSASTPADNSLISAFPANERAARSAVVTNFAVDHHDDNDANVGKHEQVTLMERSGDPSAVADQGTLYTKDVSGATEVFYRDAAGNVVQLTTGGRVRGQLKPVVKTGNYTAVAGDYLLIDKSAGNVTITLPASPAVGDEPIHIGHVLGSSNTLTIARNGNLIMGLAEDMTWVNNAFATLTWAGSSAGWRIGSIV